MVRLNWVGGEHDFALRIGELRSLQDSCNAGPEQVMVRLQNGSWRVNDIIEPIRLGLIGASEMTTAEAGPFVTNIFNQHNRLELKMTAFAIMVDALIGPEEDSPGGDQGETPPPENGDLAKSTAQDE